MTINKVYYVGCGILQTREDTCRTYALCESCAICGMMLVFMGAELTMLIPFAAATFISLPNFCPDADLIDRVTRKLEVYADIGVWQKFGFTFG